MCTWLLLTFQLAGIQHEIRLEANRCTLDYDISDFRRQDQKMVTLASKRVRLFCSSKVFTS